VSQNLGGQASSVTAASEVVEIGKHVVERADHVLKMADERLASVTRPATPAPAEKGGDEKNMPPLFSDLRAIFQTIQDRLDGIEDVLIRTEL
jgi:hypothetical protein